MSNWPTSALIRIIVAYRRYYGLIDSAYAFRYPDGSYLVLTDGPDEGYLVESRGDQIDVWEDILPVPADDVVDLRDKLRGATISERQLASVLKITSHLKSASSAPLNRAVSKVKERMAGPRTVMDTPFEQYLAQVLDVLATLQGVDSRGPQAAQVLATLARLCVEWGVEISPDRFLDWEDVLTEVRARVESNPDVGGFAAMAALAGGAASYIDDGDFGEGLAEQVLALAHLALASLAKCLGGE